MLAANTRLLSEPHDGNDTYGEQQSDVLDRGSGGQYPSWVGISHERSNDKLGVWRQRLSVGIGLDYGGQSKRCDECRERPGDSYGSGNGSGGMKSRRGLGSLVDPEEWTDAYAETEHCGIPGKLGGQSRGGVGSLVSYLLILRRAFCYTWFATWCEYSAELMRCR